MRICEVTGGLGTFSKSNVISKITFICPEPFSCGTTTCVCLIDDQSSLWLVGKFSNLVDEGTAYHSTSLPVYRFKHNSSDISLSQRSSDLIKSLLIRGGVVETGPSHRHRHFRVSELSHWESLSVVRATKTNCLGGAFTMTEGIQKSMFSSITTTSQSDTR